MTATPESFPLTFRRWLFAHFGVVIILFVGGFAAFAIAAQQLDNRFAETAREEHLDTVFKVQAGFLPGYLLIALVHAFLSYGAIRLLSRDDRRGYFRLLIYAGLWTLLLFVLSFGPMSYIGPGSIDNLARQAVRVFGPSVDAYVFFNWYLQEIFTGICLLLALLSLLHFVGRGYRRVREASALVQGFVGLFLGGLIGAGLLLWQSSQTPPERRDVAYPNIIILGSDSLRYDHLSGHGYAPAHYERPVSPHIDALIEESVDFDQMHVATASTLESVTSFLTGEWPSTHGLRYMFATKEQADRASNDPDTLPRVLRELGYRSAAMGDWAANCCSLVDYGFDRRQTSDVQNLDVFLAEVSFLGHPLVTHYFSHQLGEYVVPGMSQVTSYMNPQYLAGELQDEFDKASAEGKPFFGVLFLACTHLPFMSTYPYNSMYCDPEYRGDNRFQIHFDVDDFIQYGFADDVPEEEKRQIIGLYDGGVTMFDDIVGDFRSWLRETGLDRNTIFIVTSDHGDDLYEPGTTLGHGTNFFGGDQSTHIPFVMRLPGGQRAGTRVEGITRNVDMMPTLLDLVTAARDEGATPARHPEMDGVSLLPQVAGERKETDLAAYSETCYLFYPKKVPGEDVYAMKPADRTLEIDEDFRHLFVLKSKYHDYVIDTKDRMMRTERWKLIYVKGKRGPIWRFYDMENDPEQTVDLAGVDLPFAPLDEMKEALLKWIETGEASPWPAEAEEAR
jgi:arylsulfatase A-like enzyme